MDYLQDAAIPLDWASHGGEDIAVYASGPMSHLFHGNHELTFIAHAAKYAACVGLNKKHCEEEWEYPGCPDTSTTEPPGCPNNATKQASFSFVTFIVLYIFGQVSKH